MASTSILDTQTKPFLRWAGGKNWLVKHLPILLPKNGFVDYHEPFLGSGAIFFSVNPPNNSYLSDLNKDLVQVYKTLKTDPNGIIEELRKFKNTESFYYSIRDKVFSEPTKKAAKFIFLNQTSFNGIYRVNLKGEYNVPYGYRSKEFLNAELLLKVSRKLKKTKLFDGDFEEIKNNIKKKDLVFLDPPYTVSHNDNGFIKYNQKLFSLEDQERLSSLIDFIKRKGAYYILTNAAHKTIADIFEKSDRRFELNRANLIGGTNAQRGQTSEYIFTNTTL